MTDETRPIRQISGNLEKFQEAPRTAQPPTAASAWGAAFTREAILLSRKWIRLSFIGGDQLPQVLVDERAPCAGAVAVALEGWNQADVGKADFRFALFLRNIKDDVRASPLILFLKNSGGSLTRAKRLSCQE
jgi:hypothetical protein